jgi:phosphatidate cytidylyltransferase
MSTPSAPWLASELGARVVSGLFLAAGALLATWWGGWPFRLLWLAAGLAIVFEWTEMARVEPRRLIQSVLALGLVLAAATVFSGLASAGALALAVSGLAAFAIGRTMHDRSWAVAGLAYAVVIVIVPPLVRDRPELGIAGILWMFAVVWATDIAAYFAGRRFGGPKLWPSISPKKTWSGFAGGLAAAIAAGLAVAAVAARFDWAPPAGFVLVGALSAVASIFSQLGDLGESAMKRRFGAKDSGRLIPGHGGVMDRLDGYWAAAALVGLVMAGAELGR